MNIFHFGEFWRIVLRKKISTKGTWKQIRSEHPRLDWSRGIWFKHVTPKITFFTWLATLNRLSTRDRLVTWNSNIQLDCILCNKAEESRDHLFFDCLCSSEIWKRLTFRLLGHNFTSEWSHLTQLLEDPAFDIIIIFLIKNTFQTTIYHIWKERNFCRHGEIPLPSSSIIKFIDKTVRNRISSIGAIGDNKYEEGLCTWFRCSTSFSKMRCYPSS